MVERISSWLAPSAEDPDLRRREYLLNLVLVGLAGPGLIFGLVMLVVWALGRAPITGALAGLGVQPFYLLAYWLSRRGHVRLAAFFPVVGVFLAMTASSYQLGVGHVTLIGYAMVTLAAGILIGVGTALFFALLSTVVYLLLGMAQAAGQLPAPLAPESMYLSNAIGLGLGLSVMVIFYWISNREIDRALDQERKLSAELQIQRAELEQRVVERTEALQQRSERLEAASQVAREATAIRDVKELLNRTVHLISDRFGFYHAAIYLVDEPGEYAVLQAVSSEAGQRMLAQGHRLRVKGTASAASVPPLTPSDNPDLPETRSQATLPLEVGGRVIGVLDLQSEEAGAFTDRDVAVLQTMADQIALSIENARLLDEMQQALEELEAAYGQYAQDLWHEVSPGLRQFKGYRYQRLRVEPFDEEPPEASRARADGGPIILVHTDKAAEAGEDGRQTALAVPVRLHEQIVGALSLRFKGEGVTPDTVALVEEAADRLALALESARLYEDAQRRAARDRLMSEVTARMRESLEVETVLKTAVDEIGAALGLAALDLRLSLDDGGPDTGPEFSKEEIE